MLNINTILDVVRKYCKHYIMKIKDGIIRLSFSVKHIATVLGDLMAKGHHIAILRRIGDTAYIQLA